MVKAIIFDCFGVLYPHWLGELSQDLTQKEEDKAWQAAHRADSAQISFEEFEQRLRELTGFSINQIEHKYGNDMPPNQNLLDLIAELQDDYKIGLLSNVNRTYFDRLFEQDKLYSYFDEIVISSDLGIRKPDSRIYQKILDRLAVSPEEAIFFDDSSKNVQGAKEVGIKAFEYENLSHVSQVLKKSFLINNKPCHDHECLHK